MVAMILMGVGSVSLSSHCLDITPGGGLHLSPTLKVQQTPFGELRSGCEGDQREALLWGVVLPHN